MSWGLAKTAFKVDGIRELEVKLLTMGEKVYNRALTDAVKFGANGLKEDIKEMIDANVNRESGALRASIGVKVVRRPRKKLVYAVIGPRVGKARQMPDGSVHDPVRYAHLVEKGHGGIAPAEAKPFMRPAIDAGKDKAIGHIRDRLARWVRQESGQASRPIVGAMT